MSDLIANGEDAKNFYGICHKNPEAFKFALGDEMTIKGILRVVPELTMADPCKKTNQKTSTNIVCDSDEDAEVVKRLLMNHVYPKDLQKYVTGIKFTFTEDADKVKFVAVKCSICLEKIKIKVKVANERVKWSMFNFHRHFNAHSSIKDPKSTKRIAKENVGTAESSKAKRSKNSVRVTSTQASISTKSSDSRKKPDQSKKKTGNTNNVKNTRRSSNGHKEISSNSSNKKTPASRHRQSSSVIQSEESSEDDFDGKASTSRQKVNSRHAVHNSAPSSEDDSDHSQDEASASRKKSDFRNSSRSREQYSKSSKSKSDPKNSRRRNKNRSSEDDSNDTGDSQTIENELERSLSI